MCTGADLNVIKYKTGHDKSTLIGELYNKGGKVTFSAPFERVHFSYVTLQYCRCQNVLYGPAFLTVPAV